jgi:hypothetical protein
MRIAAIILLVLLPIFAFADGGYDPNAGGYESSKGKQQPKKPANINAVSFKDYIIEETKIDDPRVVSMFNCIEAGCLLKDGDRETIANHEIKQMYLIFDDGILQSIDISISNDYFEDVAVAMVSKYGKPTKQTVNKLQNALGAKFNSRALYWEKKTALIKIDEVHKIDESRITFMSKNHIMKSKQKRANQAPDI